jgi:hypothetical protein
MGYECRHALERKLRRNSEQRYIVTIIRLELLARPLVAMNGYGKEVPIKEKKSGCSTWQIYSA